MYERENAAPEAVRLDSAHKEVVWPHAPLETTNEAAAYGHYSPSTMQPQPPPQQQQQQQQQPSPHNPFDGVGSPMAYPASTGYAHSEGKPLPSPHEKTDRSEGTVCGLSQRNFMILFLAVLVILGAAIGGGVGGGLAARRKSSDSGPPTPSSASSSTSSSSPSSDPASSATASPSASASARLQDVAVSLDCPGIDGTRERFDQRYTFVYRCGKDVAGSAHDIVFLASYALEDCVRACTSFNRNRNSNECTAVQFNADMKACALKNVTDDAPSSVSPANRRVLAMLEL